MPTMGDAQLLCVRDFSERAAERRVVEDRVVAEATVPAGCFADLPVDPSAGFKQQRTVADDRKCADEPRRARFGRACGKPPVDLGKPFRIGRLRPDEPRGADARIATQCVDDQP